MALDRVRFEAKIDRSGDHHLWLGARSSSGSGQVRVDGKLLTAARAAYELEHGPAPTDVRVLSCPDEPACVRVDHLRLDGHHTTSASTRARRAPRGGGTTSRSRPASGRSASQPASTPQASAAEPSARCAGRGPTQRKRSPRSSPRSATAVGSSARATSNSPSTPWSSGTSSSQPKTGASTTRH